jgi:predicted aspartyl protease
MFMQKPLVFIFLFCMFTAGFRGILAYSAGEECSRQMWPSVFENVSVSSFPITDMQGNLMGVTIPLKRAGRLFFMEGSANGVQGNFILDTGASGLVLNKTYFRNSIEVEGEEGGGVTGSTGMVERIHVKKMMISDLVYSNIAADVTALGHLENRRGIKILGLFGMSLLKNVELIIDLRNNELQIYKLDKNGNRPGGTPERPKFDVTRKIQLYRNIMFVKAEIGGKELDFCLDTGAESNLLQCSAPKQAIATVTITRRSTLKGAGPGQGDILTGILNEFNFGDKQLAPMETAVCSLTDMSDKYGMSIDGMLGYDFFMKGKICINLVKKEMGIYLRKEAKK